MPTYEYQCLKCKKKFDQFQQMSDELLKKCIYCKGKVERLIGAGSGFIFKGTGFYCTDYKKKPEVRSSKPEGEAAKQEGGKEKKQETKKEVVPVKTPEPKKEK